MHALRTATILLVISLQVTSCSRKLAPEDVAVALEKTQKSTGHFSCRLGEKGWDYVCDVQGGRPGVKRIGVRLMGYYQGLPQFSQSYLPDDGPVISGEELQALRKREADAYAEKVRQRTNAITR